MLVLARRIVLYDLLQLGQPGRRHAVWVEQDGLSSSSDSLIMSAGRRAIA